MLQGSFRNWDDSTDGAPLVQIDQANSTTTYVGEAIAGSAVADAVWRIKKIVCANSDLTITWADGNTNFDNVWNNRATITYS